MSKRSIAMAGALGVLLALTAGIAKADEDKRTPEERLAAVEAKTAELQAKQEEAEEDCKFPTFALQWGSDRSARVIVTADPDIELTSVKMFPLLSARLSAEAYERMNTARRNRSRSDAGQTGVPLSDDAGEPFMVDLAATLTNDKAYAIYWQEWPPPAKASKGVADERPAAVAEGKHEVPQQAVRRVIATKEGTTLPAPLIFPGSRGTEMLDAVYAQNGWVLITYERKPDDSCKTRLVGALIQPIVERHIIGIDAGRVLALKEDGTWKSDLELALTAKSRWRRWLTGYVDLRYTYIAAAVQPADDSGDGKDDSNSAGAPKAEGDDGDATPNPFDSGGGTLRSNLYLAFHPLRTQSWSLPVGVGFTTRGVGSNVKTPTRVFAGVRIDVRAYNLLEKDEGFGKAPGFVQFGYARDKFWVWDETVAAAGNEPATTIHHDDPGRWFVEAQFSLPAVGQLYFSPRVYADIPTNGNGKSDVRVSLLARLKLADFAKFLPGGAG